MHSEIRDASREVSRGFLLLQCSTGFAESRDFFFIEFFFFLFFFSFFPFSAGQAAHVGAVSASQVMQFRARACVAPDLDGL